MSTRYHTRLALLGSALMLLCWSHAACSDDTTPEQQSGEPVILLNSGPNANAGPDQGASDMPPGVTPRPDNSSQGLANAQTDPFLDCPVEARPIYIIDADSSKLFSFNPPTLTFTEVGSVQGCPLRDARATPFSMAVDRDAGAWVLFTSGEVFIHDIRSNTCAPTMLRPTTDYALFGMGFVLDAVGSTQEELYIVGNGSGPGQGNPARLGRVDFASSQYVDIAGPLEGSPELTGTASGQLWGFFPDTTPAKVAQIDRESGELGKTFEIPQITGQPNAWAFAFWGGDFWVFYKSQDDPSSRVFRVNTRENRVDEVVSDSGRYIVGAGVSTCAPLAVQ